MRIRQVDHSIEKRIVTGMIVSHEFLEGVKAIYQPDLMAIPFAKTVAGWCLDYHDQYKTAPLRDIQGLYDTHARNGLPVDQVDAIGDFLKTLSDEFEHAPQFNAAWLLDQAEKRFKMRSLQLLTDDVQALLTQNDPGKAEQFLAEYKRVERPTAVGIEPLTDENAIAAAFDDEEKHVLFKLPGALGKLIGSVEREDLIGIMGPEKRGKTWWLMEMAMRAVNSRCNVVFFGAGDMTAPQMTRRLHTYNSKASHKHHGRMKSPIFDCMLNQDDSCTKRERLGRGSVIEEIRRTGKPPELRRMSLEDAPNWQTCIECMKDSPRDFRGTIWHEWFDVPELTAAMAIIAGKRTAERSHKRLKLSCHPTSTLTIAHADSLLDRWEREDGFVADVIVYDYFDIMAPENPKVTEERHRQNETWKAARAQAQRRHAAVIGATQADAASYDQRSLSAKNFSEDKRKYGHATKFIVLNQTDEEKQDGVQRIGTMMVRDDAFDARQQVTVLQNLNIGRPFLGSF